LKSEHCQWEALTSASHSENKSLTIGVIQWGGPINHQRNGVRRDSKKNVPASALQKAIIDFPEMLQ
jgi:hypothetical protein